MAAPTQSTLPVPPWLLAGVLVVCGVVAYSLLPSKRTLLERQLRDGATQRALVTLRSLPPQEKARNPEFYALTELGLMRQSLDPKDRAAWGRQLAVAAKACEQFGYQEKFIQELLALLTLAREPGLAYQALAGFLPKVPLPDRRMLYDALVTRALASGRPVEAAEIFSRCWEQNPALQPETTELVRLWRGAAKPDLALRAIETFTRKSGAKLAVAAPALARQRIDLLRELGQAGPAFDAARELAAASDAATSAGLFEVLVSTARESSRIAELLPEVRQKAQTSPADARLWQLTGELAVAAGKLDWATEAWQKVSGLIPTATNLFRLAQTYEWTGQPAAAFDQYLKALSAGEPAAIERLLALNPGLYRDTELAEALGKQSDVVFRGHHGLELARIEVKAGQLEAAVKTYARLVGEGPASFDLLRESGQLQLDLAEYEPALALFRRAHALEPKRIEVEKGMAECLFRLGRYEEALAQYQHLIEETADEEALESYITMAESFGQTAKVADGLRRRLRIAKTLQPRDYLRLAYFSAQQGRAAETRTALLEGLAKFPEDAQLRLEAAYALANEKQWLEAARVLAPHANLRTEPDVINLYLSLLVQAQDYRHAAGYLASGLNPAVTNTTSFLEVSAQIYEADRKLSLAARIFAALARREPANARYQLNHARLLAEMGQAKAAEAVLRPLLAQAKPETLKLGAQVYAAAGEHRLAAELQRRYLETGPAEPAKEWGFLGDVLLSRGDRINAKRAYQRGLNLMRQEIAGQAAGHADERSAK